MYTDLFLYADTWLKKKILLFLLNCTGQCLVGLSKYAQNEQSAEMNVSVSLFQISAMETNHFLILNQKLLWER